jgi:tetratricopeptide (TPR) repeat protein
MSDNQLAFKEDEIIRILNHVYDLFREGHFTEAAQELEKALKIDYEYPGITSSLKCANFWIEKEEKLGSLEDRYERGEFLILQWRHFTSFVSRIGDVSEKCLYSIKQSVFKTALECYESLYGESGIYDSDLLLNIGRCYKGIGNYEKAVEYLEIAGQQRNGSPPILAELADCYSLINEVRASKAFFREAFFLNPQEIDLSNIESAAITRLVERLKKKGLTNPELAEWLPVYATIYGVFNVKRELRPIEFGKLKQRIFQYENDIRKNRDRSGTVTPRLLNHYFWLIDHYMSAGEERSRIEEVLGKIRSLDPVIYKEYTQ